MAAKHLMVSDGVANLSMQKVADTAGTSKGGLFHHFKNKEELLNAVVGLYIAQLNTVILSITDELGAIQGRFTKAYLQVIFQDSKIGMNSNWSGLLQPFMLMLICLRCGKTGWLKNKSSSPPPIVIHSIKWYATPSKVLSLTPN